MLYTMMFNRKGLSVGDMGPLAIAMVFIAVVLGVGATVLSDVQSEQTASSYAYNASANGLQAVDQFSSWLPTIALVVAAAIVIGVLSFFRS